MSERVPFSIPVRGGELAGAVWEPVGDPTATVLAVHGIASSHLAWAWLADALPTVRIIAPDLRGRGRSRDLPGPWGMPQHAEDCLAALDALGVERVVAVGHSMGCFVVGAVIAAAGGRLDDVVFVDGGLPIPLPPGVTEADLPGALVGPIAQRLSTELPDRAASVAFWRAHPAFAGAWDARVADYAAYDVSETDGRLLPAALLPAVAADSAELHREGEILGRLAAWAGPIPFLHAPRGLLDDAPLYSLEQLRAWADRVPGLRIHQVAEVNHYTILMSEAGVAAILPVLEAALPPIPVTTPSTV